MAEAAGLALGTVALIGMFKDCIDVYGMIVAARSITDDAEILNTKLDVERMLLMQWADRIGLDEPQSYDRRLDDPDLNNTIARVLQSIKRLLSDGKALRDKYGLIDYQGVSHNIVLDDRSETTAGSTRLQSFIIRFNRLSLHNEEPQRDKPFAKRIKWVVRDREKFTSLMSEVSYFVSRLNSLLPAAEQAVRTMTEQDLAPIRSIPQLKAIVKASIDSQPQIVLIAQQMIRRLNQERILDRLWFRWIDDRKATIADRHFRTLDWALDPPDRQLKWDNLAEWLKSGIGVYWLAGKPGSGKSTLMKYLSDHPLAISLLKEWAGQSELVMSQFFFYALGRPEQKSQEGLLRGLLYQSLDKHRDLIEHVLPAMWKEVTITENQDHELAMPSISEMQTALFDLAGTAAADRKFWILIDGLDEFDGQHATIAGFVSRLERLTNVKVVVSSRPLPVFVSRFERAPKLYLQDLTNRDIEAYINDSIIHHPHMARLAHLQQESQKEIFGTLIKKASGVFLWVVLACRSILDGLEDYETVPELMSRITELPSELDDFFRRIIIGVDARKRDQCARHLRLVFENQNNFEFRYMPALGLAIIDEQGLRADYMGPSVTGLTNEELVLRCRMLDGRLRSRCCGLIELQAKSALGRHPRVGERRRIPVSAEDEAFVDSRVVFMHRSLYDFLCTEEVWEWDVLHVDNDCGAFEPNLILASLWTQLAGLQAFGNPEFKGICVEQALNHNAQAEANHCPHELLATSLSRLEGLFVGYKEAYNTLEYLAEFCLPHQSKCRKSYEALFGGLAFAIEIGMVGMIQFALEDQDGLRRTLVQPKEEDVQDCNGFSVCPREVYKLNRDLVGPSKHMPTLLPLLYHATCQPLLTTLRIANRINSLSEVNITPAEAVKYLLKAGHDPNEYFFTEKDYPKTTPWLQWLLDAKTLYPKFTTGCEYLTQQPAITLLMVNAGADIGMSGTERCHIVDNSLSRYISEAAQRTGKVSVEQARGDALWLKVRDRIQSLRTAASQQNDHSC